MKTNYLPKDISPKEAIKLQNRLKDKIVLKNELGKINTIAGADISLSKFNKNGFAGIIVYEFPKLKELERVWVKGGINFPYIPGLLSFREAPLLIKAFSKLKIKPDLAIFDGQGIAHPRRLGIASHMGLILNIPTIGCAKSRLIGEYKEPLNEACGSSYLYDNGEIIGVVIRMKTNVRPIFVSAGHKIDLSQTIEIIKKCGDGYRIPRPTREADHFVKMVKIKN